MRRVAFAVFLVLASGCTRWFRYAQPARARTYDPAVPCGPGRLLVTYHPVTHRAKGEHPPVVLFEPLVLRKEILDRGTEGGLVPYLNYRGFPVWVVFADTHEGLSSSALGTCYAQAVLSIARVTKARRIDVGGVSFGGQVAAHALPPLAEAERGGELELGRLFFYAAGIDYAYPGSFLETLAPGRGGLLATSCGDCARWLRGGARFLGALPPRSADEALPLAERFPGIAAARTPVLFVNGKIDGVAPSESAYPLFELYGSAAPSPVRKRLVIVGRENLLPDLDHWGMLSGDEEDGFEILADWLERN